MTDKQWQSLIKARDTYCQVCYKIDDTLVGHHIAMKRTDRLRYSLLNGILLCYNCHQTAHRLGRKFEHWATWQRSNAPFKSEIEWLKFKNDMV